MADRTHEVEDELTGAAPESRPEGERPSDKDESGPRDAFLSSEVADRTSLPMHDSKTRS